MVKQIFKFLKNQVKLYHLAGIHLNLIEMFADQRFGEILKTLSYEYKW